MTPEQIITTIDSKEKGCESCQWNGYSSSTRTRKPACDAGQPAYPHGGKTVCVQWYRPKAKNGNGRGRAAFRGGAR